MKVLRIYNYNERYEDVRADQVESIVHPNHTPNYFGEVILLGGRRISLGRVEGQSLRLAKELEQA